MCLVNKCLIIKGEPAGYIIMEGYTAYLYSEDLMHFFFFLHRINFVCTVGKVSHTHRSSSVHCPAVCQQKVRPLQEVLTWICSWLNFNHTPACCRPASILLLLILLFCLNVFDIDYFMHIWCSALNESVAARGGGLWGVLARVSQCRWAGWSLTLLSYEWCSNLFAVAG